MVKKYIPNEKEKYMCDKHKKFFKKKLIDWKNEIIESNAKGLYLNEVDREISSGWFETAPNFGTHHYGHICSDFGD